MEKKVKSILGLIGTFLYLVLLSTSSMYAGYIGSDRIELLISSMVVDDIESPEDCKNLTMRDSAYCLNNYVNEIYSYNLTDDNMTLTLDELKNRGGDCLDWAELYVGYIKDLGFESEMPIIKTGNETGHTFAIISDHTGYCILDQKSVKCSKLGDSED